MLEKDINEGAFFAKASHTDPSKIRARKFYEKNKNEIKARRKRLKKTIAALAHQRKKERMKKQNKNASGEPLKKYHTKKHTN